MPDSRRTPRAAGRRRPPIRPAPRGIWLLAYPGVQSLDVTGPWEVFSMATQALAGRERHDPGYRLTLRAPGGGDVASGSGLCLRADAGLAGGPGALDTLIVAGGEGVGRALEDAALIAWIRRWAPRARRVASVCTGAFLLARAGLLDGRRATTHWMAAALLARAHPRVRVDPDPIFVRDGNVYTSAGVTAGMDLALALVEEDCGRDIALAVARRLVLFLKRPGGQSQFSSQLAGQLSERAPLRELQNWIAGHPGAALTVEALAHRVAMSPRHFARVFQREVGATPARYVERVRVEVARRRLEESRQGLDEIAAACGFGSVETLRRAFLRALGVGPREYRARFQPLAPGGDASWPPRAAARSAGAGAGDSNGGPRLDAGRRG